MILIDANLLLYAYNPDAPQHQAAAAWLEDALAGPEIIGLPWQTIWAFIRISTRVGLASLSIVVTSVFERVSEWMADPRIVIIQPGPRHLELLERLIVEGQAAGPRVSDAALAALAIENGATLASTDRDFARFSNLRWVNPLG